MALIPRTELAYVAVARPLLSRRRTYNREQSYLPAQRRLGEIKRRAEGYQLNRHGETAHAFLRRNENSSYFGQRKDPSVIPFNLRLKKLAKDRNWKGAVDCLREIQQEGLVPDEISYATAIDACSKALKSRPAVMLFEEMKTAGIRPNVPLYNAVMNACARDHQWKRSLEFLKDMETDGISPNIVSYNVCLSALEKSKKWNVAVDLLRKIQASGVAMQVITYNTVISACAKSRKMKICEDLFQSMKVQGFRPDAFTYSSMLNGYRKTRDLDAIFRILSEMRGNGVPLDAVIYSTCIGACADLNQPSKAFKLFQEMKSDGVRANEIVYSCVLRACQSVEEVDTLLAEMTNLGVKKNSVVFTSAINVSHKVGGAEHAIRWFNQMLNEGIKPDWVAYMSLFEILSQEDEVASLDMFYKQGLESGVLDHYSPRQQKNMKEITLDLHGWSTALARAALRNVMQEQQKSFNEGYSIRPVVIYTGKNYSKNQPVLRPAVTKMLETEFAPQLKYTVENNGAININKKAIGDWIQSQKEAETLESEEVPDIEDMFSRYQKWAPFGNPFSSYFEPYVHADDIQVMPSHLPGRVAGLAISRWEGIDNPLHNTHEFLGRDMSPPVAYTNANAAPEYFLPEFMTNSN